MEDLSKCLINTIRMGYNDYTLTKCEELLIAGADPNYKFVDNFVGRAVTPLYLSAEKNNIELCKLLLDFGANINDLPSPLSMACISANFDLCKFFLDRGADINLKDSRGNSALQNLMHCGAFRYKDNEILKICKLLIENGFKLVDEDGVTVIDKKDSYGFLMMFHINRYNRKPIYEYIEKEVEKFLTFFYILFPLLITN
jgi:ankyrin repeat protein